MKYHVILLFVHKRSTKTTKCKIFRAELKVVHETESYFEFKWKECEVKCLNY